MLGSEVRQSPAYLALDRCVRVVCAQRQTERGRKGLEEALEGQRVRDWQERNL